ncbi:hypothetical protein Tco_0828999 [Tanacetum coccineum]
MTARITIPEPLPVPAWSDSEVARLLAISSPPASPLSPWSSSPPQIPFPLSPPSPVLTAPPPSPIRSLGYRAATIRMRAEAAATSQITTQYTTTLSILSSPPPDQMHHHPCPHQLLLHSHHYIERTDPRRDTDEIYTRLDDSSGQRHYWQGRVNSCFEIGVLIAQDTSAQGRPRRDVEKVGDSDGASDLAHGGFNISTHHSASQMQRSQSYNQRTRRRHRRCPICLRTEPQGRRERNELLIALDSSRLFRH